MTRWTDHLKSYAAKHGVSYKDAMKSADCKAAYKSMSGSGAISLPKRKAPSKRAQKLIDAAYAAQPLMEGEGIVQDTKRLGRQINRKFSKPAKKAFKQVGRVVLPFLKDAGNQLLDTVTEMAPALGGQALSALATMTGNPELIPLAQAMGEDLAGDAARGVRKIAKRKIRKSNPFGDKPLSEKEQKAKSFLNDLGTNILAAKGVDTTGRTNLGTTIGEELANKYLKPRQRRVEIEALGDAKVYQTENGDLENEDGTPYNISGNGLYGRGAKRALIQGRGMPMQWQHQALKSKPEFSNFQFTATIHPSLLGRGLYA